MKAIHESATRTQWSSGKYQDKRKSGIDWPSRTLYEADLHATVIAAFNQMIEQKDLFR